MVKDGKKFRQDFPIFLSGGPALMYTSLTGQVPPNSEGFDSVFKLTSKAAQEMFSSGCAILPRLTEYKLAQASSEVVTRSR